MSFENEAWIKDPSGSLFSGNPIYLLAKNVTFAYTNNTSYKPMSKIEIDATGSETAIGDFHNLNRRRGYNSYDGFAAVQVTVSGEIDLNNLGAISSYATMTPGVMHTIFANGHRTYYFWDSKIGSALLSDPVSGTQNPYSVTSAVPVVLISASVDASDSENILNYNLVLREDKL